MQINLIDPLDVISGNALSRFSPDDLERDDLPPRVPVRIMYVQSADWGQSDHSVVADIRESYTDEDTDTWVYYSPQRGLSCGEVVAANLREFPEEVVVQILDAVLFSLKSVSDLHQAYAEQYARNNL